MDVYKEIQEDLQKGEMYRDLQIEKGFTPDESLQAIEKSWSTDLQKRFPQGDWKTINGAKVFVNDGKVVAGLDGFNKEIDKFFDSDKEEGKSISISKDEQKPLKVSPYKDISDLKKILAKDWHDTSSKDYGAISLSGVYHAENGDIVASNTGAMTVLKNKNKDKSLNGKIIDPDGNDMHEDMKYPNYKAIVPDNPFTVTVGADELLGLANHVYKGTDNTEKGLKNKNITNINTTLSFDTPTGERIHLNPKLVTDVLSVLKSNGAEKISIEFDNDNKRAVKFVSDKGDYGVVMPLATNKCHNTLNKKIELSKEGIKDSIKKLSSESRMEKEYKKDAKNESSDFMKEVYDKLIEKEKDKRIKIVKELKEKLNLK